VTFYDDYMGDYGPRLGAMPGGCHPVPLSPPVFLYNPRLWKPAWGGTPPNMPGDPGTRGVNSQINAVAIQGDGKIVIGGLFTETLTGVTQNFIARLNANGTLDTGFNTGSDVGTDSNVDALAIQGDGKIVIGGQFTTARGVTQNRIARLNTNGTLDTGFNTGSDVGVSSGVNAIAVQPDGKIVIGGVFTNARGVTQNNVARLNTDGSLDTGFNTGSDIGVNGSVRSIAIQGDGKILVGGTFTTARGVTQNRIARLNTNGTLDTGFNTGSNIGCNGQVEAVAIQGDGKIVVGGQFTTARGITQNRIARLDTDGSLDFGFNVGGTIGVNGNVWSVAVQSDGKILVGGAFTTARGITQNRIARLNTNGTRDDQFNFSPGGAIGVGGAGTQVRAIAIQGDGKMVLGGTFTTARGFTQNRITRLDTFGLLDTGFNLGSPDGPGASVYADSLPNLGSCPNADLSVFCNPVSISHPAGGIRYFWAVKTLNWYNNFTTTGNEFPDKWADLGGPPCDGPFTWMCATGDLRADRIPSSDSTYRFLDVEFLFNFRRPATPTSFPQLFAIYNIYNYRDYGDGAVPDGPEYGSFGGLYTASAISEHYPAVPGVDGLYRDWSNRLIVMTLDVRCSEAYLWVDGELIVTLELGNNSDDEYYRYFDETLDGLPCLFDENLGGDGIGDTLDEIGQVFMILGEHASKIVPGDDPDDWFPDGAGWTGINGWAMFRGSPTAEDLDSWRTYFFPPGAPDPLPVT